ncbi:hypothetical protein GCM10023310_04470 [Paenibacillus vulneris]
MTKHVVKSFSLIGIRGECLYKDFSTALPAARAKLIENQSFVMTTYRGAVTDIWKGYQKINEYIRKNGWVEDRTSFVVELYDERFNKTSDDSEMEIYIPVRKSD